MGKASRRKKKRQPGGIEKPASGPSKNNAAPHKPSTLKSLMYVFLIAAVTVAVYSNTLDSPFQWDEGTFIRDNPVVKDLGYFTNPSSAKGLEHHGAMKRRFIGYLSFALNYKVHGLKVRGYHMVNLSIHVLNAVFVYLFIVLLFKTPRLSNTPGRLHSSEIALFGALLFAAHPVQTEAVTYIFQRFASLAAFFYILAVLLYIKARLARGQRPAYALYALSVIATVLAMKTKEHAFTLPFMLALVEFTFFYSSLRGRAIRLAPYLMTLPIVPFSLSAPKETIGAAIVQMGSIPRGLESITRLDYLYTQFRVVVTYIRLLLFPVGQNIYHDYPVFTSVLFPQVMLSIIFLTVVLTAAIYLYRQSVLKDNNSSTRKGLPALVAFSTLWFFIALSVESSVIPIPIIICEYRLYLAMAGVAVMSSVGVFMLARKLAKGGAGTRKTFFSMAAPLVLVLSVFTYQRNALWNDKVTLWEDVVKKSPDKSMGRNNLGNAYRDRGMVQESIEQLKAALQLRPDYMEAHYNIGLSYTEAGDIGIAIRHYKEAAQLDPKVPRIHDNLGVALISVGRYDEALGHHETAVRLAPESASIHDNLGIAFGVKGLADKAIEQFEAALAIDPAFARTHSNLGVAYASKGRLDDAIEQYMAAIRLMPSLSEPHLNIGNAYVAKGLADKAIEHYLTALRLKPGNPNLHSRLARAYAKKGLTDKAIEQYLIAVKLRPGSPKIHSRLARAYAKKGLADKSEEHFIIARSLENMKKRATRPQPPGVAAGIK